MKPNAKNMHTPKVANIIRIDLERISVPGQNKGGVKLIINWGYFLMTLLWYHFQCRDKEGARVSCVLRPWEGLHLN